jgi:F0F1-type ATP synthase membrane subunit b/b'
MLRQDTPRSDQRDLSPRKNFAPYRAEDFDIQRELNQLEEMILDSPRIPLTGRTIVDEEQLLDQLDLIRITLPEAFEKALAVLEKQDQILERAEDYADNIILSAEQRAALIMDELGIVRQAELEANQIKQQLIAECESIRNQTVAEIERMRRTAQEEMDELRQMTLAECEEIQTGADSYAESVLTHIDQQISDMLRIIRNGRQKLHPESPEANSSQNGTNQSSLPRSGREKLSANNSRQRPPKSN